MQIKNPCALSDLPPGCRAKVSRIDGTGNIRNRLLALGFTPDTDIEVMDCDCGRQIVKVRDCNLILDGEVASHVTCAPQAEAESECPHAKRRPRGKWGFRG